MTLPISKKTLAVGATAVSIVIAGAVLADTSSPASISTSPSPSVQVVASTSPSPSASPGATPSAAPAATPQNTPNANPDMTTVQAELNNHESRITSLENTPKPDAAPAPAPTPTVVSSYTCWRYFPVNNSNPTSQYAAVHINRMSDGTSQADSVSMGYSSQPQGMDECPSH